MIDLEWLKGKRIVFVAIVIASAWWAIATIIENQTISIAILLAIIIALITHLLRQLWEELAFRSNEAQRIAEAWNSIYKLLPTLKTLPALSSFSLAPDAGLLILKQILQSKPATIVELGSGISTMLISRLIEQEGLTTKLISIESDNDCMIECQQELIFQGTSKHVTFIYAPLTNNDVDGTNMLWYNSSVIPEGEIDMLIIDGPPERKGTSARYPAIPVLQKQLSHQAIIIADDCGRKDVKDAVEKWMKLLKGAKSKTHRLVRPVTVIKLGDDS
jgi:predicted O-methyltransferase YrrM